MMTHGQIELIENSWDLIIMNTKETGKAFYDRLFELDPSLRELFKVDMESQSRTFVAIITFVVHKLHSFHEIEDDVRALGLRHADHNVLPEHFKTVGTALIGTLESALGKAWTIELKEAWGNMYTILSNIMIAAIKNRENLQFK